MTQPAKAQEPSMEEILASIRRIIADEETAKPRAAETPPNRAAIGSESSDISEPAAHGADAEPFQQDEIDAESAAPVARGTPHFEAELDTPDLVEAMRDPEAADAAFSDIDEHANENFEDPPEAPAAHAARPTVGHLRALGAPESLLSEQATAAVNSAFGTLAHTVLVQNARTLEDLVKEMLRPMLKMWLDDNLPNLVERLVRAEIERVSRGHPG